MHRLRRCPRLFTAVDTTLRHVARNTFIQPLYQQNRIELAPRLTLTVRPERQIRTLEQQIETRLLWRPGAERAEPPPVERIIRLVAACVERQRSLSSREGHGVPPAPEVHNIITRVHQANGNRPLDAVPNYRRPLAIEMVVYRPQSAAPTTTDAPEALVSERPHERPYVTGHWPSPSPTTPPLDGSYLRRLTDSVVDALDRRTIAAYERAGRRSA